MQYNGFKQNSNSNRLIKCKILFFFCYFFVPFFFFSWFMFVVAAIYGSKIKQQPPPVSIRIDLFVFPKCQNASASVRNLVRCVNWILYFMKAQRGLCPYPTRSPFSIFFLSNGSHKNAQNHLRNSIIWKRKIYSAKLLLFNWYSSKF